MTYNNFWLGQRIAIDADIGVIRYIGEVEGHDGTWLGIDWDNPGRGKHDGSVNGKVYFKSRFVFLSFVV